MPQRIRWSTSVTELETPRAFPRLIRASQEVVSDPDYHWPGATRPGGDHCLFKFTLEGRGAFEDGQGRRDLGPGQGFLCRVKDPAVTYWLPAESRSWGFLYLVFVGEAAYTLFAAWIERHGPIVQLPVDDPLITRMRQLAHRDQVLAEAGQGLQVLNELFQACRRSWRSRPDAGAERARAAIAMMREHLADNWSVDDFARQLSVSREQLSRDLHLHTGEAPYRTYRRLRVDAAARLLVDSDESISAIATQLGWSTAAHFSRVFKQVTAMTPRHCRQRGVMPMIG